MLPSTFMSPAPQFAPAACSLAAVFIWGASDFTGGYAARRANAFVFTAAAHALALLLMLSLALAEHAPFPSRAGILWALLAGGIGGFSLAVFYRALAEGKMGLTAPIAALLGAAIPTLADIAIEGAPHAWTFAGFTLAIVAIWLITRAEPVRNSEHRQQTDWGDTPLLPPPQSLVRLFSPPPPPRQSVRHSHPTRQSSGRTS